MKKTLLAILLILSMVGGTCYAGPNDIVNLNATTILNDSQVLKNKTISKGVSSYECPIDTPVNKVAGMTYSQYIDYINEYYGYTGKNVIKGTGVVEGSEKITSASFTYAKDFGIGQNMGAEGTRRKITYISPRYNFYTELYRLYGSIALSQFGNGNGGWFTGGLYFGSDTNNSAQASTYNVKAKTDKLPPVPWFTAEMKKQGTVYVNSHSELPFLAEKGYSLVTSGLEAYYGVDTNNNGKFIGPSYVYCKVFQKGETVEIFNPANGSSNGHPPAWFFTEGTPDLITYEYGKKSSGVVATSYNKTLTDGVLYKGLFADDEASALTTGARWVSDFHPLGTGQRIASVDDPSLLGCEYFAFSINNRSKFGTVGGNILEFKVDKYCDVVILTKEADSSAVFGDFVKQTGIKSITGMFPASNVVDTLSRMGIAYSDMSIDMINDFYKNSGLTFRQICDKWLSDQFPGSTEEELLALANSAAKATTLGKEIFASLDSVSTANVSDTYHKYTVSYTKPFNPGDTVAIPDPTGKAGFERPIVVVVKPRYTSEAPDLPSTFKTLDAKVGSNSHFKPVHKYASVQNPPDFTWPQITSAYSYDVVVCSDENLTNVVYSQDEIKYAYYNFTHPFEPGTYWWAVRYRKTDGGKPSEWSVARRFRIDPSAHEYIVPDFGEVVSSVPKSHPRIWFNENTIDDFRALKDTPNGSINYQKMLAVFRSHFKTGMLEEPEYAASNATSRSTSMGYMAQNAALCYILSDDEEQKKLCADFAVEVLLELCKWDIYNGGSSFKSNDQSFFELHMRASMAYDWMYNYMVEEGRQQDLETIRNMLVERFDVLNGLSGGRGHIGSLRVEPFNSHLWSYIGYYGITCLALVHDVDGVDNYFEQMLELNSAHLPPMSIEDGGWSKGTAYWTYAFTRDKWFMDTMMYSGYINYYDKAWARNELNWALYMYPDNSYGSFGDEAGGAKAGTSHIMGLSKLGKYTNNPVAYWLRNKIGNIATQYGSGAFDAIIYADTASEEGEAPLNYPNAHLFPDQGMVAMHSSVVNSNRTSLYFRSGQYGSYNHMHADQNAFMIEHNGNRLASKSGFYDSYHSTHDKGFTRQSFAHNTITYNGGLGQKDDSKDANGNIKQFVTHLDFDAAVGDAVNAYVGNIDRFDRSIIYLRPDCYIVVDELANDTAQTYEWRLNSIANTMTVSGNKAHVENNGSHLNVEIVSPAVEDGVFENNYINPGDGVEYLPDPESSKVSAEAYEAGFDRASFKTPEVLETTIVATMSVHEGEEKTFTRTTGSNYVKLKLDGDNVTAYVCTSSGSVVTTDSGYSFKGTALVVTDASIMLVNGTALSYNGAVVMEETTEPVTLAVGKGQLSLSSNDDVVVTINKANPGISGFLPATFKAGASAFDLSDVTDVNSRPIEKYDGDAHGSMGIMMDYNDTYFTLYADKGQYMLLTEENSIINPEQLTVSDVKLTDLGEGKAMLEAQPQWEGSEVDALINGKLYKGISLPFEFSYGDETKISVKVRGSLYGDSSSWSPEYALYPAHKLNISFVKYTDNGDGTVSARVNVSNKASSGVLRCKLILASYNEAGNVVSVEQTQVCSIEKNEERIFNLDIDSTDAVSYKTFIWNGVGSVHMIDGATGDVAFKADSGVTGGYMSKLPVALEYCSKTDGHLYTNLHGRTEDDSSTVNGARVAWNYPANSTQYHEIYTADESLEGYDYFVFQAGSYSLSDEGNILSFDVVEDSEVIILSNKSNLEFEGFTSEVKDSGWIQTRYMGANFAKALRKIGITPTYAIALEYENVKDKSALSDFEEIYIREAYEKASDKTKAEFDELWKSATGFASNGRRHSAVSQMVYNTKYSRVYTLPKGEQSVNVTIPPELTGNESRDIVVVVKPYNNTGNPDTGGVCAPLAPVASSNARVKLKGVYIDGEYVPVSEFENREYSYTLTAEDGVLPVIKAEVSDNGLYCTTDYTIAEDGLSAVAQVTVKNLFTNVTPVVYTVNITLDSEASYIKDHVSGFTLLKEGTAFMGKSGDSRDPRLTTYTGDSESNRISGTSWFDYFGQRTYYTIDEVLGIENSIYLVGDNYTWCKSDEWCGTGEYAGLDDAEWMTFKVNKDCEVIIVPRNGFDPAFVTNEENGWALTTLKDDPFTFRRVKYGLQGGLVSKNMYVKSFNAGSTVTLYNSNVGKIIDAGGGGNIPYHVFVRVK